jgi:hypothetical protein
MKITDLPLATTPLSGNEVIPLVQAGVNVKAGVGTAQVLQAFGELPPGRPAQPGPVAHIPDAKGGKGPGYWDGDIWYRFGGPKTPIETEGNGIWFLGVGKCSGFAAGGEGTIRVEGETETREYPDHSGNYFVSEDGFSWFESTLPIMSLGVTSSAYANGMWVVGGQSIGIIGRVASTIDPRVFLNWRDNPPYGFTGGTNAGAATDYDNTTGLFTVPIAGGGSQTVLNDTGAADPNDPHWPDQGVDSPLLVGTSSNSCVGVGTAGPVEVRISTEVVTLDARSRDLNLFPIPRQFWGTYITDFLEVRKLGAAEWGPPAGNLLAVARPESAGLVLNGLVWGIVKSAVEFAAGAD